MGERRAVWEIAIKRASGKLAAPPDVAAMLPAQGFQELAMTAAHAEAAGDLPLHHRDPFDRLFVAQAQIEDLRLVSADARFEDYDIVVVRAGPAR